MANFISLMCAEGVPVKQTSTKPQTQKVGYEVTDSHHSLLVDFLKLQPKALIF